MSGLSMNKTVFYYVSAKGHNYQQTIPFRSVFPANGQGIPIDQTV
jgi:hypothetical protein